jgi:hypothetical protein
MLETILLTAVIYLFLSRKKLKKKWRGLDSELRELVEESSDVTAVGADIKRYLLSVIADESNDREKFSDAQLAEAQRILDRAGPGAFYWMTEIATQLAFLGAAQANGIPTNVSQELGYEVGVGGVTPAQIVEVVVQV